jgi:hypothetical protein
LEQHLNGVFGAVMFSKGHDMNFLILLVAWFVLVVVAWPLALAVLLLAPLIWLIALPFRLLGWCIGGTLALVKSLLYLPARLLGHRG